MKAICSCVFGVGLASIGGAQGPGGSPEEGRSPTFLSGRQLDVVCVHHHDAGDAGSTILYRAKEIDADKLSGRIHVGRLTAIVVRFTNVNTFCFDYEAGVTKQLAFYAGNMPQNLKPFFVGGLAPAVFAAAGAGDFVKDQSVFKNHFDAYGSLGQLTLEIRKAFADSIDPKKVNKDIRAAIALNLRNVFGYTDRDVTKEDLTVRQGELAAGITLLTKDLAKLREDADSTNTQQMNMISADEAAVSVLTGQFDNYATAITDLEQAQNAPDVIERIIMLDPKYDEYEVTAAVALLKPNPTEAASAGNPATTSSTITVDVTGKGGLDFSTGLVATHPVTHDYFLKVSGTTKTIMDGGARDPAFVPAVFVSYYVRPGPGQFAFGPTFGVDLSSGQSFYFGVALTRVGAQRFSLMGGFALNKLTVLNGDAVGQAPINGNSIQTKTRFVGGYFLGLTFNLGG
ncbi:MAG: hypothetical protein ACYC96_02750 [Fimbriimonadaceae bacterium]